MWGVMYILYKLCYLGVWGKTAHQKAIPILLAGRRQEMLFSLLLVIHRLSILWFTMGIHAQVCWMLMNACEIFKERKSTGRDKHQELSCLGVRQWTFGTISGVQMNSLVFLQSGIPSGIPSVWGQGDSRLDHMRKGFTRLEKFGWDKLFREDDNLLVKFRL